MYKLANEAEPWFTVGVLMFFFLVVGQITESLYPGNALVGLGFLALCGLGAILCSAYMTIYDKGKEAARKEQEPDEDNSCDSTT